MSFGISGIHFCIGWDDRHKAGFLDLKGEKPNRPKNRSMRELESFSECASYQEDVGRKPILGSLGKTALHLLQVERDFFNQGELPRFFPSLLCERARFAG